MGKKNIQPTTSSPVSRTLVVAPRPALEELRAEPQEGHISSLTGPEPSQQANIQKEIRLSDWDRDPTQLGTFWGNNSTTQESISGYWSTSYDGDDE